MSFDPDLVKDIRREIDGLDNKIHDLLMKRAELVTRIGEAKRKSKQPVVQPDREAIMIRRLLSRHKGPLPREAVVRIWRELVGAVSLLQTGLKVVVTVPEAGGLEYWDMAKDYFSSVLPMSRVNDPLAAIASVREGDATFGVVPWPEDAGHKPWWLHLLSEEGGERRMRITGRLPFGDRTREKRNTADMALVVSRSFYETSGEDRSFLAMEIDSGISRARIVDKLEAAGLPALSIYSHAGMNDGKSLHLAEVEGYVSADDDKMAEILKSLDQPTGLCRCLGGYPVPPVYEDKVGKSAEENSAALSAQDIAKREA